MRFLQLADAIRGLPSLPPLDPLEERILAWVARATRAGERLSVRDMMAKDELGAPATIHGRLKSMREKGWIVLADTEDARRKQVELSDAALRHFGQLSRAVVKAAKGA
nr:winged helix-turn-helix domain-containing protein [Ramlibacter cellulosilyticus]